MPLMIGVQDFRRHMSKYIKEVNKNDGFVMIANGRDKKAHCVLLSADLAQSIFEHIDPNASAIVKNMVEEANKAVEARGNYFKGTKRA